MDLKTIRQQLEETFQENRRLIGGMWEAARCRRAEHPRANRRRVRVTRSESGRKPAAPTTQPGAAQKKTGPMASPHSS